MLGDGSYQGGRILSQETVRMMYPQRFTSHPRMPGMTYGLLEDLPNGHRVLRRDGDAMNAWSRVYLMPDHYGLMAIFLVVFLFAFISWGIVPLRNRLRQRPASTGISRWGAVLMGSFGALSALFSLLWFPAVFLIWNLLGFRF